MKKNQLLRVLAEVIKEMGSMPLGEREIIEERSSVMKRSETDGHRWGIFKDQEEITRREGTGSEREKTRR